MKPLGPPRAILLCAGLVALALDAGCASGDLALSDGAVNGPSDSASSGTGGAHGGQDAPARDTRQNGGAGGGGGSQTRPDAAGTSPDTAGAGGGGGMGGMGGAMSMPDAGGTDRKIKYVFVVAMENKDATQIFGNATAPYLNSLVAKYAIATNFDDELPTFESEPHYIWMIAGTNAFADHTFTTDFDPTAGNSTSSTEHLGTQMDQTAGGITWMSYQQGITAGTGSCPIVTSGFYAPKHNPFVFFQNVTGNPPSKTNPYCVAHHKDLSALTGDLANKKVSTFNFVTPDLCNDMHGAPGCPDSNLIRAGDNFLKGALPSIIDFCNANSGVIFITWDEPLMTGKVPFLVVGPHVKAGYSNATLFNHSSLVKSIERILGLTTLPRVKDANDFADFFEPGFYP